MKRKNRLFAVASNSSKSNGLESRLGIILLRYFRLCHDSPIKTTMSAHDGENA